MRVVFDTNVWLSALFWKGEAASLVRLAERGRVGVFVSEDLLAGLVEVLQKEAKFQQFLGERKLEIEGVVRAVLDLADLVDVRRRVCVVEDDPDDDRVLEVAVASGAKYVVSYDRHLLSLEKFDGIEMVHPKAFLERLS
ncbi:putative toxin-antitoxin system toxin component, PIN family [Candidatus Pacearchaeota archaeon]|nr:putative toxin-antitoxin system toxin component, PIN family [Candidatus Pacearchaeota archaeon]|tara:strand:+ start:106 stop:522 length:417 start_codon:yes stop_codon:yes gene_type:complete